MTGGHRYFEMQFIGPVSEMKRYIRQPVQIFIEERTELQSAFRSLRGVKRHFKLKAWQTKLKTFRVHNEERAYSYSTV